jgi:alkanesulfonate monooxygenase SsuD/methylene tetrahydromethanopterin reductase-like flavin-dependent oxidoreductase (luciferase family)
MRPAHCPGLAAKFAVVAVLISHLEREMHVGAMVSPYNDADWPRYMANDFTRPPLASDLEVMNQAIEYGSMIEPLGFDSLWTTEHYGTPYAMGSDPLQWLSYWAARTERIDVGSGVLVLPWWNPFRLAHQIAMLDILLQGRRFHVGVGRGVAQHEYRSLGVDYATSRDRFNETIDILRLGDSGERFEYHGEIYNIPPSSVRPQALHKGELYRDIRLAGVTKASLDNGAQKGLGLIFVAAEPMDVMTQSVARFNELRAENGFGADQPTMMLFMHCVDSESKVEEAYGYLAHHTASSGNHYAKWNNPNYASVPGVEKDANYGSNRLIDNKVNQLIGTPDQLLEKIKTIQELTSFDRLIVHGTFTSKMSANTVKDSLKLFAKELLPTLHEMDTPLHPVSTDPVLAAELTGAILSG